MSVNFAQRFQSPDDFSPSSSAYELMPFRFARIPSMRGKVLVVNETGEFAFLSELDFRRFHEHRLTTLEPVYQDLRSKHFLLDEYAQAFWPYAVSQVRTRKSFLVGGPALHIVVVTLRCDHSCTYCQVSRQTPDVEKYDLSVQHAEHVVDRILESPADELKVEFQGGESLLGFNRIKQITESLTARAVGLGKRIEFVIASTLNSITDEHLSFFGQYGFHLSTSLDGPAWLHNKNRPRSGKNSFDLARAGLERARASLGKESVSALVTLTRESLDHPEAIIDTYVELGFRSIFLRPLSQYGFAKKSAHRIGYSETEFLKFYEKALAYIVSLNLRGIDLEETYASILLQKILTPYPNGYVDLCSPTGAMLGTLVYNYDGGVYASDEGRMLAEAGDHKFRLGDVSQSRRELFGSTNAQSILQASVAESLVGCSDCAFLPFCGADPVGNYAESGRLEGDRRISAFCRRHTGLFHLLFSHLSIPTSDGAGVISAWAFGKRFMPAQRLGQ